MKTIETPTPNMFGDIPLKKAMIGWTPISCNKEFISGRILVMPYPLEGRDYFNRFGLLCSGGACFTDWENWIDKNGLLKLYIEAWHIVARDGLDPKDVHEAFMVIPEYRDSLSGEAFFSWTNNKEKEVNSE